MLLRRIALLVTLWMAAALGACDGCQGPVKNPEPGTPADAGAAAEPALRHSPVLDERFFLLAGKKDIGNLYSSAVMVASKPGGEAIQQCSGVALSRWLILTAGHCVCARSKPEPSGARAIIDGSRCANIASVETVVYRSAGDVEEEASSETRVYTGMVRPHPSLRVVLDEKGSVMSSRADLAAIVLSQPLEDGIAAARLADSQIRPGETVVIVGHGFDELENAFDDERRFGSNKVVGMDPEGDRALIEQPGRHPYRGDSGGPCFRRSPAGPRLVGISSRWLGKGAAFTSIHASRDWIQAELQQADEGGNAGRSRRP